MFGCKHQWEQKAITYSPPILDQLKGSGFSAQRIESETLDKIMFGVTCIEYQCKCGEHYTATLIGK